MTLDVPAAAMQRFQPLPPLQLSPSVISSATGAILLERSDVDASKNPAERICFKKKPAKAGRVEGLSGVVWNAAECGEVLMDGRAAASVIPTATKGERSVS
jgi:hypothetical protein